MMLINFIKEYWTQLIFIISVLSTLHVILRTNIEATKCSLRNDILSIYDKCKNTQTISMYDLEAIEHSAELYFKLKGNSFVKDILHKVRGFKLVD